MLENSQALTSPHEIVGAIHDLIEGKQFEEAESLAREFLMKSPDEPQVLELLGAALVHQGKQSAALECFKLQASFDPLNPAAFMMTGAVLGHLGRNQESGRWLEKALQLSPDMPSANWNYALWLLLNERYKEGFAAYEWGRVCRNERRTRTLKPAWDGSMLGPDKTLFIWAEQGVGDTFMFARFIEEAHLRSGARIILEAQRDVCGLFTDHPFVDQVVAQQIDGSIPVQWDEHVSLMSLPYVFGFDTGSITGEPYLRLKTSEVEAATNLFDQSFPEGRRIGFVWAGNPKHPNDKNRSMDRENAQAIATGLHERGCIVISFQQDQEPLDNVYQPSSISDWRMTAQMLCGLDLLVTVDTGILHLAGAMGIPAVGMIPCVPEWRWGVKGEHTRWYRSVRLLRQQVPKAWPVGELMTMFSGPLPAVPSRMEVAAA